MAECSSALKTRQCEKRRVNCVSGGGGGGGGAFRNRDGLCLPQGLRPPHHTPSVFEPGPISLPALHCFISCSFSAHLMAYLLHPYFIRRILCGLIKGRTSLEFYDNYGLRCFNIRPCQAGTLVCSPCSRRGFFYVWPRSCGPSGGVMVDVYTAAMKVESSPVPLFLKVLQLYCCTSIWSLFHSRAK